MTKSFAANPAKMVLPYREKNEMGFDISYHPISPEKMDKWYFSQLKNAACGNDAQMCAIGQAEQAGAKGLFYEAVRKRKREWTIMGEKDSL